MEFHSHRRTVLSLQTAPLLLNCVESSLCRKGGEREHAHCHWRVIKCANSGCFVTASSRASASQSLPFRGPLHLTPSCRSLHKHSTAKLYSLPPDFSRGYREEKKHGRGGKRAAMRTLIILALLAVLMMAAFAYGRCCFLWLVIWRSISS